MFLAKSIYKRSGLVFCTLAAVVSAAWWLSASIQAAADNLIINPSVETAAAGQAALPAGWQNRKTGFNKANFIYPAEGQEGAKAIKIEMSNYWIGEAEWFFDDVAVAAGQEYIFSDYYQSNISSQLKVRFKQSNGRYSYLNLAKLATASSWQKAEYKFKAPANAVAATVFHLINRSGYLVTDNFALYSGEVVDTEAPQVLVTSPADNETVSGLVTLAATATDNIEVSEVQFLLDGQNIGPADSTAPYSYDLDTLVLADGGHALFAQARDSSGNTANAATVNIVVDNLPDPDLEAPTVEVTNPAPGTVISGMMSLAATASDNVAVAGVQFKIDGQEVGAEDTTSPYGLDYDSSQLIDGDHTISASARDSSGNTANAATVNIVVDNLPDPDLEAPVVAVISPTNNEIVSGTITLAAVATDNVEVSAVQFMLDGQNIGSEISFSPFTYDLDTLTLADGQHTVSAQARDSSGNLGQADSISIMVDNAPPAPDPVPINNLILNPSLEVTDANGLPEYWLSGSWGNNNAVFSYPVPGFNSDRAARVEITNYSDGDAKWFFADIAVSAGKEYFFSNHYLANANTDVTVRYLLADGSYLYQGLAILAGATEWQYFESSLTIPANATALTIFHTLTGIGELSVDEYSLTENLPGPGPDKFDQGLVSLTFDDGWYSQYANAVPLLNQAGLPGIFFIVTEDSMSTGDGLIFNPSLEQSASGSAPDGWESNSWGSNTAVFTYPVAGFGGGAAAKTEITSYSDGDAKWYFNEVAVAGGTEYHFADYYKSTVTSEVDLAYRLNDGSYQYVWLTELPATADWQRFEWNWLIPPNVVGLTVLHLIYGIGELTVDNFSLTGAAGEQLFISPGQLLEMQAAGHEIGSHTRSHPHLTELTAGQAETEIAGARADLLALGLAPVEVFAYPYGEYNSAVKDIAIQSGYSGARGVIRGYNTKTTDKYLLKIQQVDRTTTVAEVKGWIDSANNNYSWLILMFHQIEQQGDEYSTTPEILSEIVNYLSASNTKVVTMGQGLGQMAP